MSQIYWIIRFVLASSVCAYFIVVPAVLLRKMMAGNPSQLWRLVSGLASIFGVGVAIVIQGFLCGNPAHTPNVKSVGNFVFVTLMILDLILIFSTYTWYYYKNKSMNK